MLFPTRQQLHMKFIQVYLQRGKSILPHGSQRLIVLSSIRPVQVA